MMSIICSVARLCRLLSPNNNVTSFLIRCDKFSLRTQVFFHPLPLYAFHVIKFHNVMSSETDSGDSERTFDNLQIRMEKLEQTFGFTRKEVENIFLKDRRLEYINVDDLFRTIDHVDFQDISLTAIKENPWILTLKPDHLDRRLSLIRRFDFKNISDAIPLLQIALPRLALICWLWEKESDLFLGSTRIKYISKMLQCPVSIVCQLMVKYRFLQMMPASRLKENLELMLNAGISTSNILKDMWSLRTNPEFVETRLWEAKEVGLPILKPWLVRCKQQVFERTLERHIQSQTLLGTKSFFEFLADRLNCDVQAVQVMTQRYPNIVHVNVPKIKEILDFLQEQGFSVEQIQQVPRILCHSLETTRARLAQLQALGFNPMSIMVLCLSQSDYRKLVNKLKQRNTRVAL